MNTIDNTIPAALTQSTTPDTKPASLGQEDFLRLMVAQLENQDPNKPMENGQFLGQMAQFGTVSGITDLQKSFTDLAAALSSNQALQASALVGRSVLVNSTTADLGDNGEIKGAIDVPSTTPDVVVTIQDSSGQPVRHLSLGAQGEGLQNFVWDGLTDDGEAASPGQYRIQAAGMNNGEPVAMDTLIATPVESVSLGTGGQGITLNLSGYGALDFSKVRQIM
jgi:flagellar basal-body rod modification protein FlgD